jgi:hypothetical protein
MVVRISKCSVLFIATLLYLQDVCSCSLEKNGLFHLITDLSESVVFDSGACHTIPGVIALRGDEDNSRTKNIFAFISDENRLFLSVAPDPYCPTSVCRGCTILFSKPFEILLPGVDIAKVAGMVITDVKTYPDSLTLLLALNSGPTEVFVAEIAVRISLNGGSSVIECAVRSSEQISLKVNVSGQSIRGLAKMEKDSSFMVFGDKGLLRELYYSDIDGKLNELIKDVDPTDDLVCGGDSLVGSSDGTVYRIGNPQPLVELGAPLLTVNRTGAGGKDGFLAERAGERWNVYSAGEMNVKYFRFFNSIRGMKAYIVDDTFNLYQVTVRDSATKLYSDLPEIEAAINGGMFEFTGTKSLNANFTLYDAEKNEEPPMVVLHQADTVKSLVNLNGTYNYCECGKIALNRSQFSMIISSDSIFFNGNCLQSICPVECGEFQCGWTAGSCSTAVKWKVNDTLVISTGKDTLRILNGAEISARERLPLPGNSNILYLTLLRSVKSLQRGAFPSGLSDDMSLCIYDLAGNRISTNRSYGKLQSGVYVAVLRQGNVSVEKVFHLIR